MIVTILHEVVFRYQDCAGSPLSLSRPPSFVLGAGPPQLVISFPPFF